MADSDQGKSKRRFKNPQTFREKAIKTAETKTRPIRESSKFGNALKAPFRALKAGYLKLKTVKSLKPLFKVLSLLSRVLLPKYFRTSFEELKKVTWPSLKQSRRLTYAVMIFAIIFGASIAIVDWGLGKIFKHILLK